MSLIITDLTSSLAAHPSFDNHERVVKFEDPATGLKAIIAVHNTNLGPSLGGCRFYPYADEAGAINDVLRLSRGMTYKSALAYLPLGGGKAVIIGNPKTDKTPEKMQAFGKAVEYMAGSYITAEDVGTTEHDMVEIAKHTTYVSGLPPETADNGVTGNPSPMTAYGVFQAIKAGVVRCFGSDKIAGHKFAVQGLGAVGYALCEYLIEAGGIVIAADVNEAALNKAAKQFPAAQFSAVSPEQIHKVDADVFCPCAMGASLNDKTIPELQVLLVCGAANNQLAEEKHNAMMSAMGVHYVPDYAANSGGVTAVAYEYFARQNRNPFPYPLNAENLREHVDKIYQTTFDILAMAEDGQMQTGVAADEAARAIFLQKKAA